MRIDDCDALMSLQVNFAYGLTGENIPPFGCMAIGSTPQNVAKLFVSISVAQTVTCLKLILMF